MDIISLGPVVQNVLLVNLLWFVYFIEQLVIHVLVPQYVNHAQVDIFWMGSSVFRAVRLGSTVILCFVYVLVVYIFDFNPLSVKKILLMEDFFTFLFLCLRTKISILRSQKIPGEKFSVGFLRVFLLSKYSSLWEIGNFPCVCQNVDKFTMKIFRIFQIWFFYYLISSN